MQRIITNLAVLDITNEKLVLIQLAPGVTTEHVQAATGTELAVAG